ncbi:MAG: DUF4003 domain-containing protein [Eubacterium sp.]|nr:DUF4003 domain-containing protein [Eubacterium sp.]
MKEDHPFLTSDSDFCFATVLSLTDKSVDQIVEELETTFQNLKPNFKYHDNAIHSLSQVLTSYAGDPDDKAERSLTLYEALRVAGIKYGKETELASLGTLLRVKMAPDVLAKEIAETSDYLKSKL